MMNGTDKIKLTLATLLLVGVAILTGPIFYGRHLGTLARSRVEEIIVNSPVPLNDAKVLHAPTGPTAILCGHVRSEADKAVLIAYVEQNLDPRLRSHICFHNVGIDTNMINKAMAEETNANQPSDATR